MAQIHPPDPDQAEPTGLASDRRRFIKRAAIAGGAVAWATPTVQILSERVAGAAGSPPPTSGPTSSEDTTPTSDDTTVPTDPDTIGCLTGTVINAQTGNPISEAVVTVVPSGETAMTGSDGVYTIASAPAGDQTVTAAKSPFVTGTNTATITPEDECAVSDFALSRTGAIRVVLTWNDVEPDLDLHISGPDGGAGRFHLSFKNKTPVPHATLDLDDKDGFGPETATIRESTTHDYVPGSYHVWAQNPSKENTNYPPTDAIITLSDINSQVAQLSVADAIGDATLAIWHAFDFTVDTDGNVTVTPVQQYADGTPNTVI